MKDNDPLATCPDCKRCREWCGCKPEEEEYPVATFYEPPKWGWTAEGFVVREAIREMTRAMEASDE